MAHKRNPITSENASGLARIVRAFIIPSYENNLLWHERDLANSDAERFTLSHTGTLLEDVLRKTERVLRDLWVDRDRMMANIASQRGLVMAEKVMIEVVDLGMARDQAHEVLRTASFQALSSGDELLAVCERTEAITNLVDTETLASMFDPMSHVGFQR